MTYLFLDPDLYARVIAHRPELTVTRRLVTAILSLQFEPLAWVWGWHTTTVFQPFPCDSGWDWTVPVSTDDAADHTLATWLLALPCGLNPWALYPCETGWAVKYLGATPSIYYNGDSPLTALAAFWLSRPSTAKGTQ